MELFEASLTPPPNVNDYYQQSVANQIGLQAGKFGLTSDDEHWFYQVGSSRGGRFRAGGIVWCDFDHEFQPIEDLRQIVGHTSQYMTGVSKQHNSEGFANIVDANNICIDCFMSEYLTLTNGKLELKHYLDL